MSIISTEKGFLSIYMSITYLQFTSHKIQTKNKTKNRITQSPDSNILESTWEHKITKIAKQINKTIIIINEKIKLFPKFRFIDKRIHLKKQFVKSLIQQDIIN